MPTESTKLYEKLAETLKSQIRDGVLAPGDRLPSVRQCSSIRGISVSTVLHAYGLLEDGGWIHARPKSGYFVSPPRTSKAPVTKPFSEPEMLIHPLQMVSVHAIDHDDLLTPMEFLQNDPGLGAAVPDPEILPVERLVRLQVRAARDFASDLSYYPEKPIHEGFARALTRRTVAYPVPSRPEDFIATAGCIEGL